MQDSQLVLKTLVFPEHKSILEGATLFLEEITELAKFTVSPESEISFNAVVITQQHACGDLTPSWLNELEESELLSNLALRIMEFRRALRLIRYSRVPWFFYSADNLFSSGFELALACHKIVFASAQQLCGGPTK